jgi:hypothetical protein
MKATPALSATALVLLGSPTLPQTPLPNVPCTKTLAAFP